MNVRDKLLKGGLPLTPSEERIVQALLTDYPTAGLGTAASLAKRAGVSDPTVVRLAMKLGFEGFPDFQRQLLAEVEESLRSPLLMMEAKRPEKQADGSDGPAIAYMRSVANCLDRAVASIPSTTYERAARLFLESKGQVILLGGRFSRHIAGMLAGYLSQFRADVTYVETLSAQQFDLLVDLGKRDLLIVFDYRRYQLDVVSFSEQAAARGVRIMLFTDPWLSPIAKHAELTLACPVDASSPYDTMATAVAQVEALVAQILAASGERARDRIEALEAIRVAASVTFDTPRKPGPSTSRQE